MVKEMEVKVFEERLYCDKCETEMQATGAVLCSYPPQYEHYCPKCNYAFSDHEIDYPICPECGIFLDFEPWHRVNDNESED